MAAPKRKNNKNYKKPQIINNLFKRGGHVIKINIMYLKSSCGGFSQKSRFHTKGFPQPNRILKFFKIAGSNIS